MEIDPSRIVISIINFAILYLILRHFLFNPVNQVIEAREKGIADRIDRTEENSIKAEQLRIERENSLKLMEEEGKRIVESYKSKAEDISQEIISEAKGEAQLTVDRARTEMRLEQEKIKEELKTEMIGLALTFAEKALANSLDEDMHKRIVSDFIYKVDI